MAQKILEYLQAQDMPLSPYAIYTSLGLNPGSTRARICELAKSGQIERVGPGLYQYVSTQGVRAGKIQNWLATCHPEPALSRDLLEELARRGLIQKGPRGGYYHVYEFQGPPSGSPEGLVIQRLQLGFTRNKITWTIKAPLGLDYYGLMFAYGLVCCTLSRLGLKKYEFMVINHEYLADKFSIKIEGAQAITFQDFKGNLEKLYNKAYGVRHETRDTSPRPVDELLALYQGGLPSFMIAQASYDIAREVQKNTEAIKYLNWYTAENSKTSTEILNALWRLLDEIGKK